MEESSSGQELKSNLPFLGADGLERTGQAWVRQGLLTATIVVPPTTSTALDALVASLQRGIAQAEPTLVESKSFPSHKELTSRATG